MIRKYENSPVKCVAAIHDLSGFGRCALTVVIPALSSMGHQTVPLPTALLSTHTGGYENFAFTDLTDYMRQTSAHWQKLALSFDAVYSGFLGNAEQIDVVSDFILHFKRQNTVVLVDPVMGDDGKPYATITESLRNRMKQLVGMADIITPNITEACFLLGIEHPKEPLTEGLVCDMLGKLSQMGPERVVITGIALTEDTMSSACYDAADGKPFFRTHKRIKRNYPGTGDLFASVLLGSLLNGKSMRESCTVASDFVYDVMLDTSAYNLPERNGVLLERNLYKLTEDRSEK